MSKMSEIATEFDYLLSALRAYREKHPDKRPDIIAITTSVARSGMSRTVWFGFQHNGRTYALNGLMMDIGIGSCPRSHAAGIAISGCGMDFHADAVMRLSEFVFGDDRALYCYRV